MRRAAIPAALAGVAALLLGLAYFVIAQPVKVLPRMSLAPGFALLDQRGERLTSDDLRGSIVVFTFAPGTCGAECAAIHGAMADLARELDDLDTGGVPVRLVTISLDPARDTPAALAGSAAALGADGERWSLVTGEPSVVRQVVGEGFGVFYAEREDGSVRFDPAFVIVDGWGLTRATHRIGVPSAAALGAQLRVLGAEIRASTGVARYAYEAAHLFSCYAN
jgi:protein SCO1